MDDTILEPTDAELSDRSSKYCNVTEHGNDFVSPKREQIQV